MNKYTDLDLDHKREFLVNSRVSAMACALVCKLIDSNECTTQLWQQAYDQIASLPDTEVERVIAELEENRQPFDYPKGKRICIEAFPQN